MSDYMWDRTGPPDPETERLERVLGELRYRGEFETRRSPQRLEPRRRWPLAVAAMVLISIAAAWLLSRPAGERTIWTIEAANGPAFAGGRAAAPSSPLYSGQLLRTGERGRLVLQAEDFGRIEVAADSELHVAESRASSQRFSMPRGRIHVLIWAPPRQFVVDTPSARAVDLGCQYTLSVDSAGDGLVNVETGWVAFQFRGRESFIPAGASCATSKLNGPGTPFYRDASDAFRRGLASFDKSGDSQALAPVLAEARARDGFTLWHLLTRAHAIARATVFDRFAALVPLPREVTCEGVIAGDAKMLDLCWNSLHLENTDWWREWKREWRP